MSTEETPTMGFTSDTLDAVISHPQTSSVQNSRPHSRGYLALWRGVPRELGFLLLTLPLVWACFVLLNGLFWAGIGTLIIYIGFFLVVAAIYVARGFGTLELVRLRWAGRAEIEPPRWVPENKPAGFIRVTFGPFVNGHYWLYLLHSYLINPIVGTVTWVLSIVWVAGGLGGISYWFWSSFIPSDNDHFSLSHTVFGAVFRGVTPGFDPVVGDGVLMFVGGVIFLLTLPFLTHGLTLVHNGIARGMLGAWRSEELQREVTDLSASRGAAVTAEDQSLRRLERDLHDGPQQRLIRLQMDLASAERKLDADPDAARGLLEEARGQARDTLEELRALSRGFAPPILQDRGLITGLESLASRSTVPVHVDIRLDAALRLPPEIERSAYYVAAELLTNVAKHANASEARLYAGLRRDPDGDTTWLDVWVTDNGSGGASVQNGHGLRGLDERLRGLRGILEVQSPIGGPSLVGAHIPVTMTAETSLPLS